MQNRHEVLDEQVKKSKKFSEDLSKLQTTFENVNKKRDELDKREKDLVNDRSVLNTQINKLESDLFTLLKTINSFQEEAIANAVDSYKRAQAEAEYRANAEAKQRGIAEAAHKVLAEAAERAKAEADYRSKIEEAQRELIEEAKKTQAAAAMKIQTEFSKGIPKADEKPAETAQKENKETDFKPKT
jgi:chromosome segregation ATPase